MIISVLALSLAPYVSLTLVEEGGSWRFESWSCHPWRQLPSPHAADLAQRFSTAGDAEAHFRALLSARRTIGATTPPTLRAPLRNRRPLRLREEEPARARQLDVAADEPHGQHWRLPR